MNLQQRLQLIVDATTDKADASFRKLTGTTRELGTSAERSADQVRAAAQRVADARETEVRAAGQLRTAEARLQELRQSGRAKASQLVAAEERAATAQRTLQRAVNGTESALREQQEALQASTREMGESSRGAGLLANVSDRAKGAVAGIGAATVVNTLRNLATGFADSANAAGQFATSTNSSVEQAGAFLGLVGSLGLELNDLLEIQAEYAEKAAAGAGDLEKLGAQLVRNSDRTVNWTESIVLFLDQLQQVPDATERNRLGFQFLGEEGYKQLSRLVSSGTDVREALEMIGTPFSPDDVRAAQDFDTAMMRLSLAGTAAGQSLGRVLVPAVTGLLEGFGDVLDVLEDAGPVLVTTTALAIALGITGFSPTAVAGARLAAITAVVTRNLALFRAAAVTGGAGAAVLAAGMAGATAAGRGLATIVGGPLGVALIGLAAGYTLASQGLDDFREASREAAIQQAEAEERYGDMAASSRELGQQLQREAGFWQNLAAAQRANADVFEGTGASDPAGFLSFFDNGSAAAAGYAQEIDAAREELGEFGAQQEVTTRTTQNLNDLVAQGITTGAEFGAAVTVAAEAQNRQERSSGLAAAAIDAYNAVTRDAVESTLDLWNAQLQQRDGLRGLQGAIQDAAETVQDSETPWNDVAEAVDRVTGAALDYASTSADAAVAAARASGDVVDAQAEASIRGQETLRALYETLQQPGITAGARGQVRELIGDLQEAQESGDVEAILRLTGAAETSGEIDDATKDRDTTVRVESRNGPAVDDYLNGLADRKRLALIRVESRNGPAVDDYLATLMGRGRLALIRVESRNGPAVDAYLDGLASQTRVAYIDVRERGGTGAGGGSTGTGAPAMLRGAPGSGGSMYGSAGSVTIQQQTVVLQADATGRVSQQSLATAGRDVVAQIRAYERRNGTSWRGGQGGQR